MLWNDDYIPFSGVLFFLLCEKLLECHHGKDRNVGAKRKYQQKQVDVFSVFFYVLYRRMNGMFPFSQGQTKIKQKVILPNICFHRMSRLKVTMGATRRGNNLCRTLRS